MSVQTGWNGFVVVDKPCGLTSREVVNQIQKQLPRKTKVGHAGTLDPLATGVLVLAIGSGTRLVEEVQNQTKLYSAKIRLGYTSTTDDADGEISPYPHSQEVSLEQVRRLIPNFVGQIQQCPPQVSALKIEGHRAHDLARKGIAFSLAPRTVRIDAIEIVSLQENELSIEVTCGKGTYIRSLARDFGKALGTGGYIKTLRRERIGPFQTDGALKLPTSAEAIEKALQPLSSAVPDAPRIELDAQELTKLSHGQPIERTESDLAQVGAYFEGNLVAVGFIRQGKFWANKVLFRF